MCCVLSEVVKDGPEVNAEELMCVVTATIKVLEVKVERGQLKQSMVLPGFKKINKTVS